MPSPTHGPELTELHQSIGVVVIGYVFSMILYGFNAYQFYIYFSSVSHEHFSIKALIGSLAILDATSVGTLTQYVHFYLIQEFPKILPAVTSVSKEFSVDNALSVVIVSLVLFGYMQEVKKYSNLAAGVVGTLTAASLGLGLTIVNRDFDSLGSQPIKAIVGSCQFLALAATLLTFVVLYSKEERNQPTSHSGSRPVWYDGAIRIGFELLLLPALFQLGYFIAFVGFPEHRFWIPFQIVTRRVFSLSLVTLYINRAVLHGRVVQDQLTSTAASSTIKMHAASFPSQMARSTAFGSEGGIGSLDKHDAGDEGFGNTDRGVFHIAVTRTVVDDLDHGVGNYKEDGIDNSHAWDAK